ncbi:MAG TPA: lipopolysaccharide assembly protein LapA domain-containing protein [Actinocrinis sp.]|jgi:uncharacterized integral membrane protein
MSGNQSTDPTGTNVAQGAAGAAGNGQAPAQPAPGTVPPGQPAPGSGPTPSSGPAPAPAPESEAERIKKDVGVARTRLGGVWVSLISGTVVLVLLLVFILMNGQHVRINFYGAHWDLPLGVALLMAAAIGILLVVIPGVGRMLQLRATARRARKRAAAAAG